MCSSDLHYGGLLLKVLYAVLALAACAVVLTGNLIWLERRDAARAHRGHRVLERLTVGVCGGVVLAAAAYFVANRVLPLGLERRADVEFGVFLGVWALAAVGPLWPRLTPRRAGVGLCAGAAVLYAGVVLVDLVRQEVHLFTALPRGAPSVFLAHVLLCALALGSASLAWALARRGSAGASPAERATTYSRR